MWQMLQFIFSQSMYRVDGTLNWRLPTLMPYWIEIWGGRGGREFCPLNLNKLEGSMWGCGSGLLTNSV